MSLISYIEKLRTRPEADRKKISVSVAFVVTGIIFAIWAFTIISSISTRPSEVTSETSSADSVYSEIRERWNSLVENVSTLFVDPIDESPATVEEELYFDALEGIPADVVEVDTGDSSLDSTMAE